MTSLFQRGNRASVGHGRPRKNFYIKCLESGHFETIPLRILQAIASGDRIVLQQFQIPHKQVNLQARALATGFLHLRTQHE